MAKPFLLSYAHKHLHKVNCVLELGPLTYPVWYTRPHKNKGKTDTISARLEMKCFSALLTQGEYNIWVLPAFEPAMTEEESFYNAIK